MRRNVVLFYIHYNSYFNSLFGVAQELLNSEFQPVCMFLTNYPTMAIDVQQCTKIGIRAVDINWNDISVPDLKEAGRKKIRPKNFGVFLGALKRVKLLFYQFKSIFSRTLFWKQRIRSIRAQILSQNVVLNILGGDIPGADTAAVIKAGHLEGIKSIAFVNWLGRFEGASIYAANPEHQLSEPINKFVSLVFSEWVHNYNGTKILKLPGPEIIALKLVGLSPKDPWVLHSGNLDFIAVEGDEMRSTAISMGLDPLKLVSAGSIHNDYMKQSLDQVEAKKENLLSSLSLPQKPVILTALPPDSLYEINGVPQCPGCDFAHYEELVDFWIKSLIQTGFNVVVCLHPSVNEKEFLFIEKWGAKISRLKTSELIPLCDIYVACISATINWAIACGKPVINYDVYRYGYTDYVNASGVFTIEEQPDFLNVLHKLTQDPQFLKKSTQDQKQGASKWALLDGSAGKRLVDLIRKHSVIP